MLRDLISQFSQFWSVHPSVGQRCVKRFSSCFRESTEYSLSSPLVIVLMTCAVIKYDHQKFSTTFINTAINNSTRSNLYRSSTPSFSNHIQLSHGKLNHITTYIWTTTLPKMKKKNSRNVFNVCKKLPPVIPCLNRNHRTHTNGVEISRNAKTTPTVTVKSCFQASAQYIVWNPITWCIKVCLSIPVLISLTHRVEAG